MGVSFFRLEKVQMSGGGFWPQDTLFSVDFIDLDFFICILLKTLKISGFEFEIAVRL